MTVRRSYHIGTVAKLTGVSTHTIRVWERRYGAVSPRRSPGGTREYSDDDIAKLTLLKLLTDAGHSIGQIAGLDMGSLRGMVDTSRARPPMATTPNAATVQTFLSAVERMDIEAAERALDEASRLFGLVDVVFNVVGPITREIGERWASGELRIAHEHAATAVLRNFLAAVIARQRSPGDAPVAACTTLSGELHELGALMSAFVAVASGWRCVYLGPNLPVGEIAHVVDTTGASMLLLSLVNTRTDDTAKQLRDLLAVLPDDLEVRAGGRSHQQYGDVLSRRQQVSTLGSLYQQLTAQPVPVS